MTTLAIYIAAALAEIAGWAWLRLGASPLWLRLGASPLWLLPDLAALALFALLLAQSEAAAAGRANAAYGGIYIAAALGWLWAVEGLRPDRWDLIGAVLCLAGATLVLDGPASPEPVPPPPARC